MSGTVTIPNGNTTQYDNSLTLPQGTVIPSLNPNTTVLTSYKTVSATGSAGNPGTVAVSVDISGMPSGIGIKYEIYVDGAVVGSAIITGSGSFSHTVTNRSHTNPATVEIGAGMGGSAYTLTSAGTIVDHVTCGDYGMG